MWILEVIGFYKGNYIKGNAILETLQIVLVVIVKVAVLK